MFVFSGNWRWVTGNFSAITRHHRQPFEGKFMAKSRLLALSPSPPSPPTEVYSDTHPSFQENTFAVLHRPGFPGIEQLFFASLLLGVFALRFCVIFLSAPPLLCISALRFSLLSHSQRHLPVFPLHWHKLHSRCFAPVLSPRKCHCGGSSRVSRCTAFALQQQFSRFPPFSAAANFALNHQSIALFDKYFGTINPIITDWHHQTNLP
jgi:hypothetical protein